MPVEKIDHQTCDFVNFLIKRKMTRVEEMHLGVS